MIHVRQWRTDWDRDLEVWLASDLRGVIVRRFRKLLQAENFCTRGTTEGEVAA